MSIKIGAILSPYGPSRGLQVKTYSQAVENLKRQGIEIEIRLENLLSSDQASAEVDESFTQWIEQEADCLLVLFPPSYDGLFKQLQELRNKITFPVIPLSPQCAMLGNIDKAHLRKVWDYQKYGGLENIQNLLLYAGNLTGKLIQQVPPPIELPGRGIYHPDHGEAFESLQEYLTWYPQKNKETIGMIFPRTFWIEKALGLYDVLINELEKRGFNVIAVFNDKFGSEGDDSAMREFFFSEGRPVIDLLLAQAYFFVRTKRQRESADLHHEEVDVLKQLNVPTIQIMNTIQPRREWESNPEGLTVPQLIIYITLPEFDGFSQPILIGTSEEEIDPVTGASAQVPVPLEDQISFVAKRIEKWCGLRKKHNSEKKIAIILLNAPCKSGAEATVGSGFGLDTLESTARILNELKKEGYSLDWVPRDGKELIDRIMEKKAISEFRWTPLAEIIKKGGAAGFVPLESYKEWIGELPQDAREKIFSSWGNPFEGIKDSPENKVQKLSLALYNNQITISGLLSGNVFIGIQPKRGCAGAQCDGTVCKILHDPEVPPPHQYIAYYKWIEKMFNADAMIHVGTHGNLELLPGKTVAMSSSCFSHFLAGPLPHLYVYVVSNPMEGVIAKRRGYAVLIDHLHPVMSDSGVYGSLDELDEVIEEYTRAVKTNDHSRAKILQEIIIEKAASAQFVKTADEFKEFTKFVDYLHGQLAMLKETMIRDGLHILGQVPQGEQLIDMLFSILRFDQGRVPSLRRAILEILGLDYDKVISQPELFNQKAAMTNKRLLDLTIKTGKSIIQGLLEMNEISEGKILNIALPVIKEYFVDLPVSGDKNKHDKLVKIIRFGLSLLPKINRTTDELDNILRGFNGEFIEPGASGALARGKVEILPTGRNFYAVDPWKIPTPAAWKVGVDLAHKFFHKYLHEHKDYPQAVGFIFRFFDVFRADGELVSQILYTLGVRPLWDGSRVTGLEVIPLEELNRPRVDCVIQLSNMLRDGMPRAFEIVDEAVQLVAALDEPLDKNYVRKHVLESMGQSEKNRSESDAFRYSTFRVFTAAPGVYDYGVNTAVAASAWQEDKDLAEIFMDTCGYAYGRGVFGQAAKQELRENLKKITVTYDKWDSDEYDVLECCHIYGSGGGFTLAAKEMAGKEIKAYFGDTHDPQRPQIRDMKEELERVARTRLLNPKWIEGKKRHGYKGAAVISDRIYHLYGWQATTRLVDDWVFNDIAETFVLDKEMREWFEENNKWALESLNRRLLEAQQRGLWNADPEILEKLKTSYIEIEGLLEGSMEDAGGDFQGGNINVVKVKRSG